MPILDTDKIDFLWKKVIFGVSKTASGTAKYGSNETIASPLPVYNSNIWANTDGSSIPATPPGSNTSYVTLYTGANRIRMTNDATSSPNITWLATTTFGTASSIIGDFIPGTFGTGYNVKVYIGDPNGGPAARIFPDTTGEEWVFDYAAGVLHFPNSVPGTKTATIGSGSVTVASNGIYIEVYRYTGTKGLTVAGGASKIYVVANITARNALTGLNAGDVAYVTDASGIPTDAASGEYATYLWTGAAWSLLSTQDSARTDALTKSYVVSPSSNGTVFLGNIGNGGRVVEVSVSVETAFDGNMALSVGDSGDNNRVMDATLNDLQTLGYYVANPVYQFPANAETPLNIYFTGTSTVGNATVTITYA